MGRAARFATLVALVAGFVLPAGAGRRRDRPPATARQASSPPALQAPGPVLTTVVLDPAHGGTDEGAHGASGIAEKDVTLALARVIEARLTRDGWKVVMTRQSDATLSFAQRAAISNAQASSIFLTLHVGTSGSLGYADAYYYDFARIAGNPAPPAAAGMLNWNEAQRPWERYSRSLAQLLQAELADRLPGSPQQPAAAEVYQLRAVDSPAVAVELASVNAPSADVLLALSRPLAASISAALQSFRTAYGTEVH